MSGASSVSSASGLAPIFRPPIPASPNTPGSLKSELSVLKTKVQMLTSDKTELLAQLFAAQERARVSDVRVGILERKIATLRLQRADLPRDALPETPRMAENISDHQWAEKIAAVRADKTSAETRLRRELEAAHQEISDLRKVHEKERTQLVETHERQVKFLRRTDSKENARLCRKLAAVSAVMGQLQIEVSLQHKNAHEIAAEAELDLEEQRFALAERKLRISLSLADKEIYGPDFLADLHASLGVACHSQGKFAEAESAYRSALNLDEKAHACWANLASLLRVTGLREEALVAIDTARSLAGERNLEHYLRIRGEILREVQVQV